MYRDRNVNDVGSLVFDSEMVWLSLFGLKLISQAYKKLPEYQIKKIKIRKEELRLKSISFSWINEISSMVFNWFVESDIDEYISEDVEDIRKIIKELSYEEYHEDICFNSYADDEEFKEHLTCGLCRECKDCLDIYKAYLEQFRVGRRTIVLDERIDVTKLSNWEIENIPNLITNDFVWENVVYKVYVGEKSNEVVIDYIDDYSGYFSDMRDHEVRENLQVIKNMISMIE